MVQIFSFAWLELVSHGSFMPKLLTANGQKGWPYFQRLLVDLFQFMESCSSWIRLAWELFYFAMSQICYDHYWLRLDFQEICMILYLFILLLVALLIFGSWLGFWFVRKLLLTDDGSIDSGASHFVSWSIRIVASVLILQSSIDPLLAAEALVGGAFVLHC
ncbi:hypothetical protein ACS0TY_011678 [Phlomoides rotata]